MGVATIGQRGFGPAKCEKCRVKTPEKIRLERKLSRRATREKASLAVARIIDRNKRASAARFDCANRDKCLVEELLKDPNCETLMCYGCERYRPDERGIEMFVPAFVESEFAIEYAEF